MKPKRSDHRNSDNRLQRCLLMLCLLMICQLAQAVFINTRGTGEVNIVPYYTVNNELNTLFSVTNTTDQAKAIKVTFREGLNGYAMLSYSVYLDAHDTWTGALIAWESSVFGYEGQPSIAHITGDSSCAPYLNIGTVQEFLPFALIDGPQEMSRGREGFIEVMEMGVLTGDMAAAVDTGFDGVPASCVTIDHAWNGGIWTDDPTTDMSPPTGGLMVDASLINVTEGINYSIPVTALADFYPEGEIPHVIVGDIDLSLDAAQPQATVLGSEGVEVLNFSRGIDAVSGVLMANKVSVSYVLDTVVNAQTDLVFSQPTRRFYLTPAGSIAPPFNSNVGNVDGCAVSNSENTVYGGVELDEVVFNRSSQEPVPQGDGLGQPPEPVQSLCGSVAVISMYLCDREQPGLPRITGSENHINLSSLCFEDPAENGFVWVRFEDTRTLDAMNSDGFMVNMHGLPIVGLSLMQYTNSGAMPGLLAQYGAAVKASYERTIEVSQQEAAHE